MNSDKFMIPMPNLQYYVNMGFTLAGKVPQLIKNFLGDVETKSFINMKSVTLGVMFGIGVSKLWRLCLNNRTSNVVSDCIFFSPIKLECDLNCLKNKTYGGYPSSSSPYMSISPCNGCSIKHLISMIHKARNHLDICMYLITSQAISCAILEVFRRGVNVRVIIDKHMSEDAYGANVIDLRKAYVPVKVIQSSYIMHNKFVVIDNEIVMSGSLNWTRQALFGNYENVMIVADKAVARKFSKYFYFIWNLTDEWQGVSDHSTR